MPYSKNKELLVAILLTFLLSVANIRYLLRDTLMKSHPSCYKLLPHYFDNAVWSISLQVQSYIVFTIIACLRHSLKFANTDPRLFFISACI